MLVGMFNSCCFPASDSDIEDLTEQVNLLKIEGKLKGQMNQNFDILSLAILKQPNAGRIHY